MDTKLSKDTEIGTLLQPLKFPPLSRHTLALYCGASWDHNPLHVDIDYAKKLGMPDIIGHGMLNMAYMGRLVLALTDQKHLKNLSARFSAPTAPGDELVCSGTIIDKSCSTDHTTFTLELSLDEKKGKNVAKGEAIVII